MQFHVINAPVILGVLENNAGVNRIVFPAVDFQHKKRQKNKNTNS